MAHPFEVEQVELLAEVDVIQRLEVEIAGLVPAATHFEIGLIVRPDGSLRVREVGNRSQDRVGFGQCAVQLDLRRRSLLAQAAALFLAGLALGGILRLADRLADFIGLPIQVVERGLMFPAIGLQGDETIDVGFRAAI